MLKIPKGGNVIIVGDIHEHEEQIDKLLDEVSLSNKSILISVGDIYDKGFGVSIAESIVDKFIYLNTKGLAYIVKGNHELKLIRTAKRSRTLTSQLEWLNKQPLSIMVEFYNRTRVVVVHGGVRPGHTFKDLNSDVKISYMRNLDKDGNFIRLDRKVSNGKLTLEDSKPGGKPWHYFYDGRFGYIASGHASQKDGLPKFYNYSCNLDTAVYHTGILTAQIFSSNGRGDLLTFKGQAKYPDINNLYSALYKESI